MFERTKEMLKNESFPEGQIRTGNSTINHLRNAMNNFVEEVENLLDDKQKRTAASEPEPITKETKTQKKKGSKVN